jgi:hypothetical protein
MGWQAQTGVPGSMVGGGAVIEPGRSGQATSYVDHRRPTAVYLGRPYRGAPGGHAPSQAQLRSDLAYWHLAGILAVASGTSQLGRYLAATFGPPTIETGAVLAWRHPVLHVSRG